MSTLGNIIWFFLGGLIGGIMWIIAGLLCCVTIIGIPLGLQCFKFASLSCFPFGKEIKYGGGVFSLFSNIIWIVFCGLAMSFIYLIFGIVWAITIVGIPFAKFSFRMAKLSLMPFGAQIVKK